MPHRRVFDVGDVQIPLPHQGNQCVGVRRFVHPVVLTAVDDEVTARRRKFLRVVIGAALAEEFGDIAVIAHGAVDGPRQVGAFGEVEIEVGHRAEGENSVDPVAGEHRVGEHRIAAHAAAAEDERAVVGDGEFGFHRGHHLVGEFDGGLIHPVPRVNEGVDEEHAAMGELDVAAVKRGSHLHAAEAGEVQADRLDFSPEGFVGNVGERTQLIDVHDLFPGRNWFLIRTLKNNTSSKRVYQATLV